MSVKIDSTYFASTNASAATAILACVANFSGTINAAKK